MKPKSANPLDLFRKNGTLLCGLVLLPALILSTGCMSGNRQPAWLTNPKTVYPDSDYLVAVGTGDTRHSAENAAAASLSRIFESHIESDERLLDQTLETQSSFDRTTSFSSDINILSAQTLYNIQFAEAWKDSLGRYHAVAYLNRSDTAKIYRDKISEQTTRVNFLRSNAELTDNILQKYATLRTANRHAQEADYLLRQLNVIHPRSVPDATPSYSLNQLGKALADTAKEIKVEIHVDGDEKNRMQATLQDFITRYGFVIGTPAILKIDTQIEVADTGEREQGLIFVRYEMLLQITDPDGNGVVTVLDKGREAHKTMEQARTRSFRTLENSIQANGAQRLDLYFDSLIDQP
ncbi:LPP20 family lipoprotein [Pontiella agarivorans]|uniref:LPP20 family lipoprotein n=1 Tax=Pontiella agarivorans TaxID=3038953 RepID=A0ABU5MYU5_9BACT|nr:LPP20 family lipoprotein [Pontiella agarivorans]MDZ8119343.1 LPP20 family lipoprotein [Pontiella agarivorans]